MANNQLQANKFVSWPDIDMSSGGFSAVSRFTLHWSQTFVVLDQCDSNVMPFKISG